MAGDPGRILVQGYPPFLIRVEPVSGRCAPRSRRLYTLPFFQSVLTDGLGGPWIGGCKDRLGTRYVVFDVDGTRQVARQRAVVTGPEYPPVRRRFDAVCKKGYTGRKRGEVVRTRSVLQQAHTHEWMGTWAAPGNGDGWGDLKMASACIGQYMDHHQLPRSIAISRLDGLYGHIPPIAEVQKEGLGYVTRCCDYGMLNDPTVLAAIAAGPVETMVQPDTGTRRILFDIPVVEWHAGGHPPIITRMIVARTFREPGKRVRVGRRAPEWTDEVFVTSLPPDGWSAADVLDLYFGRGGFEGTLAQDDAEQLADHWCSRHPAGQELWQILHQWIWNLRIWLGKPEDAVVRETEMAPAHVPSVFQPMMETIDATESAIGMPSEPPPDILEEPSVPPITMPPAPCPAESSALGEVANATGRGSGRFGGKDFRWQSGALVCPAGQTLRRISERAEPKGIRLIFRAPARACANCAKKDQCLAPGARLQGRKVSVWKGATSAAPIAEIAPEGPPIVSEPIKLSELPTRLPPPSSALGLAPILWEDIPASVWRRTIQVEFKLQRVEVEGQPEPTSARMSRGERAHRRLTWHQRHQRNARRKCATWEIRLHGIPERICKWLNHNAETFGGA